MLFVRLCCAGLLTHLFQQIFVATQRSKGAKLLGALAVVAAELVLLKPLGLQLAPTALAVAFSYFIHHAAHLPCVHQSEYCARGQWLYRDS